MSRPFATCGLLASLLFTTAACTQTPAQIDLRGQNTYGRSGSYATNNATPSYPAYSPSGSSSGVNGRSQSATIQTGTVQTAAIQSIGVSDLSPSAGGKPPRNTI